MAPWDSPARMAAMRRAAREETVTGIFMAELY
jgi:hypothetical protein